MIIINYYLLLINIFQFFLMGYDKLQAIKNKNRISEKKLIIFSLIGGSLGSLLGMYIFRHKTKKLKFRILYPLFLILHIFIYLQIKKTL